MRIVSHMPGGSLCRRCNPHVIKGLDVFDEFLDKEYSPRCSGHFRAQLEDKAGTEFSVGIEFGDPIG